MNFEKLEYKYIKMVFLLAAPVMLQQFLGASATLIDNLMVGTLGADAINAVGASGQIFFVIMLIGFGITEGTSIFIAQQFGSKKFHEMHLTFVIGIIMSVSIGIIGSVAVLLFQETFIGFFTREPAQQALAFEFLKIIVWMYPLSLSSMMIGSAYRSCGQTKIPMIAGIISIATNTMINYLLIAGMFGFPALGVRGAAIATVLAKLLELVILIVIMKRNHMPFMPEFMDFFKVPLNLVKEVTKKTIPLITNEFLWGFGMTTLMALYGAKSAEDYTSVTIAYTTANLLFVVLGGFAVSVSILIGQELGRGAMAEAKRNSIRLFEIGLITGLTVSVIAVILSFVVPDFFSVSEEIKQTAARIMQVIALVFPLYVISATSFFILRAGGDVKGVLMMDSGIMWFVVIPLAIVVVKFTDLNIVTTYLIVQSIEIVKTVIGFWRFKTGIWLKKIV
ncbi:MAG: MATE family efflux transporter [Mycoplasmatales bacterium]